MWWCCSLGIEGICWSHFAVPHWRVMTHSSLCTGLQEGPCDWQCMHGTSPSGSAHNVNHDPSRLRLGMLKHPSSCKSRIVHWYRFGKVTACLPAMLGSKDQCMDLSGCLWRDPKGIYVQTGWWVWQHIRSVLVGWIYLVKGLGSCSGVSWLPTAKAVGHPNPYPHCHFPILSLPQGQEALGMSRVARSPPSRGSNGLLCQLPCDRVMTCEWWQIVEPEDCCRLLIQVQYSPLYKHVRILTAWLFDLIAGPSPGESLIPEH